MVVSIFNDVIGPVMRGASSSHCAAALRIASVNIKTINTFAVYVNNGSGTLVDGDFMFIVTAR